MRISVFCVKGLFGEFDYEFNIKPDQNIFLLTGPNGYGKTTILRIVKELSRKNLYFFYLLPFKEIRIEFENDDELSIISEELSGKIDASVSDTEISKDRELTFKWLQKGHLVASLLLNKSVVQKALAHYDARFTFRYQKRLHDYDEEMWLQEGESKQLYISKMIEDQNPGQFFLFLSGMSVRMLPSSRLSNTRYNEVRDISVSEPTIEDVSDRLKKLLEEYYYSYLKTVNNSNSGVFDKLLRNQTPISKEEYEAEVAELSSRLLQLYEWGLSSEKNIRPYVDEHKDVMTVYIQELKNNLTVYQDVYDKLLLFTELLEDKKFVNKKISFTPKDGLTARNRSGVKIDLKRLSSGEQHEIIMLYYSIFGVGRNSMLLIDEPENSLHVAWQLKYYQELETIANKLGIQVIIATHSPQIIGERWDECYDLYDAMMGHGEFDTDSTSEK